MIRNKGYYREMRKKHINHKKKIADFIHSYYKYDGTLSKGKIHCSCSMCRAKVNNKGRHRNYFPTKNWKHSDMIRIASMNAEIADYENEQLLSA